MPLFYGTFGSGTPLGKYYIPVHAESEIAARLYMNEHFRRWWCGLYPEEMYTAAIAVYPIQELQLPGNLRTTSDNPAREADYVYS